VPDRERNHWWVVVAAGLEVFMASVDMSIVNIALPAVERDFTIPTSMTEWVVLAYLLPLAGLALPSGPLAGQRRTTTGPRVLAHRLRNRERRPPAPSS
jgi:MFS family permease